MQQKKMLSSIDKNIQKNNENQAKASQQIPTLKKSKSGIDILKKYLLKKTQNMYKLNLSDEEAFKWKFHKNKNSRPLSSFRLIKKQGQQIPQVTSEDLMNYNFPVLAHKNKDLARFAVTLLKQNKYFKQKFGNEQFLNKLVTQLSLNYNIVSYHNFSHAFSLTLMLFQSFQFHSQLNNIYSSEQKFYAMVAGLAHDLNHPGTNNSFEIKTKSQRAVQFNNQSVLQNFHIHEFWKILQKNPQINFLNKVNNTQEVKKRITYLILMTDVAQHFKNLQKFKQIKQAAEKQNKNVLQFQENKQFFLGQLFHACDIGNPCIDFDNYITWAALLSHQFNEQTILQKENDVQITQMLRYKDLKTFYKGQIGFINYLVFPLWKQIASVCDNLKIFTKNIDDNIKILNNKIETAKQQDQYEEIHL